MKETNFGIEQTGVKTIRNQICNESIWIILGISLIGILGRTAFLIEGRHWPGYPVTASVLRTVMKEVH